MKLLQRLLAVLLVAIMIVPACVFSASAAMTLGDVSGNGKIDTLDYLLVKRHVIGTLVLTDEQQKVADVSGNGKVDTLDYLMIKRHVIGTLVIQPKGYSSETVGDAVEIENNVFYQKYTVNSGEFEGSESVVAMEFNPADGYIPMVFSANACNYWEYDSGVLETQYDSTYGQYGLLNGNIISNGKVVSAHADHPDTVVAFDKDGNMDFVDSKLQFKLFIDGKEVPNGVYYVNKHSGHKVASAWSERFYYYDTSCGAAATTYEIYPGYEVICEKINNSELAVGDTLYGRVLEIKENSYGSAIADDAYDMSDKFVLFVGAESSYASYLEGVVEVEIVNIQVNETVSASKEVMENANSVIPNVGFLVKDGVDLTQTKATIGTHSVTLRARWTAFGQKADGSYVFMTSEGGSTGEDGRSITLRDVAKFMIEQGCVNVIRMDGGGSSAMYVKNTGDGEPGYLQYSSRDVGDCILIVKKDSARDEELEAVLNARINAAKAIVAEEANAAISAAIAEAEAVLAQDVPLSGEVRREINDLAAAVSGRDRIAALISEAGKAKFTDFSAENLEDLREAYATALISLTAPDVTYGESKYVCDTLEAVLATKGEGNLLSDGIYITGFNTSILTGNVTIFTPDFGVISHATANHKWTRNMILTWSEIDNAYVVTETFLGGGNAKDVNLEANQIFIAAHEDESLDESIQNILNFEAAQVGQKLVLSGIDIENKTAGFLSYIQFID